METTEPTEPTASMPSAAEAETLAARLPLRTAGRLSIAGRLAVVVVCVAVFLTALDQTVVVTALVSMMNDIGLPVTQLDRAAWIVSGYLLGYVIAMPLMGRVSDIYGRWRVFAVCLVIFGVGSLICALSPILGSDIAPDTTTLGGTLIAPFYAAVQWLMGPLSRLGVDTSLPGLVVLVGARFVQAIGGGALVPVAMAVVGDLFGSARRGLALGLVGAVTEAGGVLGPVWGAFVTTTWSWQWIFYLNIPVALALFAAGFFCIPRRRGAREPIDVPGALLFGISLTLLTLGLGQQSGQPGVFSVAARSSLDPRLLLAALLFFALFVAVELRRRWPVVEPAMFRRAAFSAAAVLSLLVGAALIVALVQIPLFVATLVSTSPTHQEIDGGLALLRLTALIPIGALAGGWLSGRFGCRPTAVLGLLFTSAGFWLMHLWPSGAGWLQITAATATAGLGFGLVIAPISTSALNGSERRQAGVASAVVTALRMSGMILGLAALASWGLARFKSLMAAHSPPGTPGGETAAAYAQALSASLHQVYTDLFAVTALVTLVGIVPALLLWRRSAHATEAQGPPGYESYVAPLA
jgi:MFS family permease